MRFRNPGAVLAAAVALLACVLPAHAADNYPIRDGTGASQTFCSKQVGGVQHPCHLLEGLNGNVPKAVTVDGSGSLSVNVGSSVLPAGASTAANQATANTSLGQIATNTTGAATAANQTTANTKLDTVATNQTAVQATPGSDATKAVSVQGCTSCKAVSVLTGATSTNGSGTITTGGAAQALFGGVTPTNGFKIAIPSATNDGTVCWVSDTTTTPSATTAGSYPVFAQGQWSSEPGEKPAGPVYLTCQTTGQPFSAKRW